MTTETLGWYGSIFFWLFFTGIGIPPCPEEAGIIYAAGVTALHDQVRWWAAWPMASAGILAADTTLYFLGYWWGPKLFQFRWVNRIIPAERRQRIESRFHEHGIKILIMARFLPPLRTGVFLIAGAIHFSFLNFMIADLVYAVVGVGIVFFGSTFLIDIIHRAGHWVFYTVAIVAALYGLYRFYLLLRKRELKKLGAPPISVLELSENSDPAKKAECGSSMP